MIGPEIAGALMAGFSAALFTSFQAAKRSSRIEDQVKPNDDGGHSTIRQMLTDLLHSQTLLSEQLGRHDAQQRSNGERIERIERKLDRHLLADES